MIKLNYKLAFIVPYRDREEHLRIYVPHYKKIFPDADIYVIHQLGNGPFNRGKLLNAGYLYAKDKADAFDLSDVDMLAVEDQVDYSEPSEVTHLASSVSQFGFLLPYPTYFSGHVLLKGKHMESVNGFYNDYLGYGCEDDCFYRSFIEKNLPVHRRYGLYHSLDHPRLVDTDEDLMDHFNKNFEMLKKPRDFSNGLSSCNYMIEDIVEFKGYTMVNVLI
ncbi:MULTISPECIES: galactosyltransferase-related protein [Sphingobacterium]|uniref:galactosyltransferase-related protein n=1 Tax=Sphingobacterium TaxID=28453 RepID=UPI00257D856E|nr:MULTISPECIES: galactosyltransferase-related protein [Sphingobacterium]